jgi:membrane-associated phospholipid phosphatase
MKRPIVALLLSIVAVSPSTRAAGHPLSDDLVLGPDGSAPRLLAVAGDPPRAAAVGEAAARAGVTPGLGVTGLARLAWHDLGAVVVAPAHWDRRDWTVAGGVGAAVVGSALWLDSPARDAAIRNRTAGRDSTAKQVERFGAQYAVATLAGLYGYGVVTGDENAKGTALDGGIASLIAAGVITPVLKDVVGRARPLQGEGRYRFKPFSGDASFPSGHTTEAFALATVVAEHADSRWVTAGAYGVATLVGVARVYRDAHWVSDTIAGAAIGAFVGHEVVALDAKFGQHAHLEPASILGVPSLALRMDF